MKKIICVAVMAFSAGIVSDAMAQSSVGNTAVGNTYVTGNIGQSNLRNTGINDHIDTAGGVGLGWKFNQNVAAEISYTNMGKFSGDFADAKAEAYQASLIGSYDVAPKWSVYGRLGVARTSLDVSDTGTTRKTTGLYGIGTQYQINPQLAATLEYNQYHSFAGSEDKLNTATVGLKYSF